ncbi:hypothetical protein HA466_0039100 [Hirschfeldia incana]|nr:hypothetical protein HA466_0039100 [Hirschfeldia incana]
MINFCIGGGVQLEKADDVVIMTVGSLFAFVLMDLRFMILAGTVY